MLLAVLALLVFSTPSISISFYCAHKSDASLDAPGCDHVFILLVEGSPFPCITDKSWRDLYVLYNEKKELDTWSDSSCLSLTPAEGVWVNAFGWMMEKRHILVLISPLFVWPHSTTCVYL